MNHFACALYRQLANTPGNLSFSPFSVATALAMAGEGARGETARQMAQVLGLDAATTTDDSSGVQAFCVPLPMRADGLAALESILDGDDLARWMKALAPRPVFVALPKFRLEADVDLARPLGALGMARALALPTQDGGGAQFDGISASADPRRRVYIGAVVHKAVVAVDEKGTEAAAATAVLMAAGRRWCARLRSRPKCAPTIRSCSRSAIPARATWCSLGGWCSRNRGEAGVVIRDS